MISFRNNFSDKNLPTLNERLVIAAQENDSIGITTALEAGADVHYNDDDALQWAARNGHENAVYMLLKAGANPSANNDNAIRWAEANGHDDIVEMLKSAKRKQMTFADRVNEAINENNTTYKNSDKFKVLNVDRMTPDGKMVKPAVIYRAKIRDLIYVPGLPIVVNKRKPDYKEKYLQAIDLLSAQSGQDYSAYKTKFLEMTKNS